MQNTAAKACLVIALAAGFVPAQAELIDLTDGKIYDFSMSHASWKSRPNLQVPRAVLSRSIAGSYTLVIKLLVDTEGNITHTQLSQSSGDRRLDNYALDAFKKAKLHPFMIHGTAVNGVAYVPVQFIIPETTPEDASADERR